MTMTAARGALVRALRRPWKTIALLTVYPGIDKCPRQSMEAADRAFRGLYIWEPKSPKKGAQSGYERLYTRAR